MPRVRTRKTFEQSRQKIGATVRELRVARNLTQADLAKRLQISQARLSQIEHGTGSFTAEQFLELLRLFNVTASKFVDDSPDPAGELQNALARLGATHLQESSLVPSATLDQAQDAVREAIVDGTPRLVTALAAVLTLNADTLNLTKLYAELERLGLERRLAWVVENTLLALDAVSKERGSGAKGWSKLKRRAEVPLRLFIERVARGDNPRWRGAPDILDPTIRSLRTVEELKRSASEPSERWGIVTSLQTDDFVQALKASHATG